MHAYLLKFLLRIYLSLVERLPAECHDYCKLTNGWVWLSHEHVEDGCKSTCVKFGDRKPDGTGDIHVWAITVLYSKIIYPVMG